MNAKRHPSGREPSLLDPAEWEDFNTLLGDVAKSLTEELASIDDRPVWKPVPDFVAAHFSEAVPAEGTPLREVWQSLQEHLLPYPLGNHHPRFWGWVIGTGTAEGLLSALIEAAHNPNMFGGDCAALRVELQVQSWLKQLFGFPSDGSALLTSGASMANLIALAIARQKAWPEVGEKGVLCTDGKARIYASKATHMCITRAAVLLGLGREAVVAIPVDSAQRLDIEALRAQISSDLGQGYRPFCLVGNAGTVDTGAIDPLVDLAALAREHGLWFHVDGAFGAAAWLCKEMRPKLAGMDEADSLAFDLHKWFYQPYALGCVLTKHKAVHRATFSEEANYLAPVSPLFDEVQEERPGTYGPELSRSFKALRLYLSLKHHGVRRFEHAIRRNIEQAAYLEAMVKRSPELELTATVALNVVCFRFIGHGHTMSEERLNRLNQELLRRLQSQGRVLPSHTVLEGRFSLRSAITNHRTSIEDIDILIDETLAVGRHLLAHHEP